jgi:ferritin-like metal-binding protein YciE
MITITDGKWIADLGAMTCRNIEKRITVAFERNGKTLRGKIQDMPAGLLAQWAGEEAQGERRIRHMVEEAEEVFLRAWFERKIEQGKEQIIDLEQDEEI